MVARRDAFDDIADELYGLPVKDFTAARTAAAAQAKNDGDTELAGRIAQLKKPNTAGWLANQLVRRHPKEIEDLADLGETLRDAMRRLAGDELRQAAGRQQQAVYALVQLAEQVAAEQGQGASADAKRGLEQTLHAALVDPEVAAELTAGRLTGPLSRTGFPDIAIGSAAAFAPPAPAKPKSGKTPGKAGKDADEEAEERQAERQAIAEAEAAATAYKEAQKAVERLEKAVGQAKAAVERLNDELETALNEQNRTEAELRRARREMRAAEQAARRAAQRLPQ